MKNFIFTECISNFGKTVPDLYVIQPTVHGDARGYFMETFNAEFSEYVKHIDGSPAAFVQDNESCSRKGVLRGLHYQKTQPQGKLVRVIEGEVYDIAVDLRHQSPTYGQYYGILLSNENKLQFYIPEGFAHGFLVLSEIAVFVYKCTRPYAPQDEGGLLWNDPDIGIEWPVGNIENILLSDKDTSNPTFEQLQAKGFYY